MAIIDQLTAILGMPDARERLAQRFWAKVRKSTIPGECWLWSASTDQNGYGQIMTVLDKRRIPIKAPRVAWALINGPIPSGLHMLHRCDTPRCCNPDHLYPGTPKQNSADAIERRRHVPPPYHGRGANHPTAKLNPERAKEIRESSGTQTEKAARFGLSQSHISNIMRGSCW